MNKGPEIVHVLTVIDGSSEELTHVAELSSFEKGAFMLQFDVDPKRDPEMLDRYAVGPDDVSFLERHLQEQITFDFQRFAYFIEAARRE